MISHKLKKLPKSTVEAEVVIPKKTIQEEYDKAFEVLREDLEAEGFRKGKAPKQVAEKLISKDSVYQHMIRMLFPKIYQDILKKEEIKPVISPKIELVKAKEGEDWEIKISVAEKPSITLPDYKKIREQAIADGKKEGIWVPGKDKTEPTEQELAQKNQQLLNKVLDELLKKAKIEISDLILQEELDSRLARLVDDVNKLGMTVESYLKSKNTTMEALRAQYLAEIENVHKMEFLLNEIAEKENIQVGDEELTKLFGGIKNDQEKNAAQQNAYFYAALLRKQKTLDFLIGL